MAVIDHLTDDDITEVYNIMVTTSLWFSGPFFEFRKRSVWNHAGGANGLWVEVYALRENFKRSLALLEKAGCSPGPLFNHGSGG